MTSFQGHARTIKQEVLLGSHLDRIENYLQKRHVRTMYETWLCETGNSHSGGNDYKSLFGYNLSMVRQLLTFVRPLLPPSSELKHLQDGDNVLPRSRIPDDKYSLQSLYGEYDRPLLLY